MPSENSPQLFLKPIERMSLAIVIGMFLIIQTHPQDEPRRWSLNVLLFLFAAVTLVSISKVISRYYLHPLFIYGGILFHSASIALADYLLTAVDLSPLYFLRIIVSAMLWNRRAALFSALVASIFQPLTALAGGMPLSEGQAQFAIRAGAYFLSALLVSELARALTARWRDAAREAELQRAEIARRNDDLEALSDVAQAFVTMEDIHTTIRRVTERIAALLGAEKCFLARLEGEWVRGMPPGYGLSDDEITAFEYPNFPELVSQWNLRQRDALVANDFSQVSPHLKTDLDSLGFHQLVAARMIWRGHPTGIVFVGNKRPGGHFDEKDTRLLSILTGQASIAVENARLYREAQTGLRDVMRLYATSSQLVAQLDPEQIPQRVVSSISQALSAPIVTIALLDQASGELRYAASVGVPEEGLKTQFRKNGIGMTVLRTGTPKFIENAEASDEVSSVSRSWGYKALACIPIRHRDQTVGVLYVNYRESHQFPENERGMLALFANQAAVALENARLHRAERMKTTELTALANLSHSLAETLNLNEIFPMIEDQVRLNLPQADAGALLIFDPQTQLLAPRSSFGFNREVLANVTLRPGESLPGKVFQTNRAMLVSGREAVSELLRESMRPENLRLFEQAAYLRGYPQSIIGAPLHVGTQVLGVIVLDCFRSPNAFTSEDLRLLEAMGDRAALAIRNAQLLERERKRAIQLNAIAEVGSRVVSILDLDKLLAAIAKLIRAHFDYRYVHLFLNNPAQKQLILRAGELLELDDFVIRYDQGIVGWVAAHGEMVLANDVSKDARFMFHASVPDTRAELTVPIKSHTRLIGVLDAQSDKVNAFEPSDVATLQTLANQAAIAIENARLYGELREQAQRDSLTQVYTHGYFLTRLSQETSAALENRQALSLIMLDIDFFKEYNDQYGHVFGDQVLGTIVQAIRANIKQKDIVGRWGGEEFGIVLPSADTGRARIVAERIRQTLSTMRIDKDSRTIKPPTVSQGIASLPQHALDAARLIDLADAALYRAKSRGRDQVRVAK